MPLPLERIKGKYEIVAKIREGGMGAVYRVRHRLLDELRVVKVLRPQLSRDAGLRARFLAEARAAIRLRHPNIVQIHDFMLDDDGIGMIVMENIDGIDLRQLRASGLPSIALGLEIARQALRALGYLHRSGFVHRDISPDNLMLSRDPEGMPQVKLIDLGIAKDQRSDLHLTESGVFLGKFRYASPEHFAAEKSDHIEARSDLYALGAVLYELFTGHHPIHGDEAASLIAGHLFRPPHGFAETDPEGRVPADLRAPLLRSLAKRPADRFRDAGAMAGALAAVQARFSCDDAVRDETRSHIARPAAANAAQPAGSTQMRLDADFELSTTPAPSERVQLADLPMPGADSTESAEAAFDDPFDQHIAAGCTRAADEDFEGAVAAFEQALALRPESAAVRLLLDEAHASQRPADDQQVAGGQVAGGQVGDDHTLAAARERLAAGSLTGAIACITEAVGITEPVGSTPAAGLDEPVECAARRAETNDDAD